MAKSTRRSKAQEKRDQYTMVLEEIREQYKALAEGAAMEAQQWARRDKEIAKIGKLSEDMDVVKAELSIIRRDQVSRAELTLLEKRVHRLERKLAARR